jgi:hydrogenase maturation protease
VTGQPQASDFGFRPSFGLPTSERNGTARQTNPAAEAALFPSPRLLVLGLGNDILTDDAVGLRVAHELRRDLAGHPSVDIRQTTEMGLALLDFLTGYRAVVLVDSIQTGRAAPGFLHELDAASSSQLTGRTPHFVGVSETLALGRELGLAMPEQVKIFAIEVADPFTLGTVMTPALEAALPGLVAQIRAALQPLLQP